MARLPHMIDDDELVRTSQHMTRGQIARLQWAARQRKTSIAALTREAVDLFLAVNRIPEAIPVTPIVERETAHVA